MKSKREEGYLWLRLVRRKAFWRAANKNMPAKTPSPLVPGSLLGLACSFTFHVDTSLPTPTPSTSCHRRITLES